MAINKLSKKQSPLCTYSHWLFFKIAAFYCFMLGIIIWIRILGFYNGALWRIDLMPRSMQIFSIIFAILYPIACCGLWYESRWGKLLWGALMGLELWFFIDFSDHFPFTQTIVIINFIFVIFYLMHRLICRRY